MELGACNVEAELVTTVPDTRATLGIWHHNLGNFPYSISKQIAEAQPPSLVIHQFPGSTRICSEALC